MRLSFGWLLLLTSLPAHASEPSATPPQEKAALRWVRTDGAASCPAQAAVALAIEQRLGAGALVPKEQASLVVEAELAARAAGGFRAQIALMRGEEVVGRRELESEDPSCLRLAETAALVIALTIDPEASLEPLPIVAAVPAPAPAEPRPAPPAKMPAPAVRAAREASGRHGQPAPAWRSELELAVGIATGIVPNVAGGLHVRGRAFPPALPFGVELQGAYFPAKRLEALPGKGADFTVFYAGAGLCSGAQRARRLSGLLCAGAEVGAVAGQGYGFSITPSFRAWTFGLGVRGALAFRVRPPFAVVIGPWLAVPLKRDHFEVKTRAGTEELFRPAKLGLGFDLGVSWEL